MGPPTMPLIRAAAAAKLNLYLHVLGRNADGYHRLDSLVAFASVHDVVEVAPSDYFSLSIQGPFALPLLMEDTDKNLVARAVKALAAELGRAPDVAVTLVKNLPVASGIGGGSADAAAALRAVAALWELPDDHPALATVAPKLGADVPVCLAGRTAYFAETGTVLTPAPDLPEGWVVLVNPGVGLHTAKVFGARTGAYSNPDRLDPMPADMVELAQALQQRRNDLTLAAQGLCPGVAEVLAALDATPGSLLARMSGSGATCFGLYADAESAVLAAQLIARARPQWWVQAAGLVNDVSGVQVVEA